MRVPELANLMKPVESICVATPVVPPVEGKQLPETDEVQTVLRSVRFVLPAPASTRMPLVEPLHTVSCTTPVCAPPFTVTHAACVSPSPETVTAPMLFALSLRFVLTT